MKYLVIIIAIVTLASAGAVAYLYLNPGFLHSISSDKIGSQATSDQSKDLSSGLNKLQNELTNLKDTLAKQSLSIQELSRQSGIDRDRLVSLEKKLQSLVAENKGFKPQESPAEKTDLSGTPFQNFSPELFNNPEFAKLFRDQVDQAMKDIQKKEEETRMARFSERIQQMVARRIEEFAKTQNLNDYQKQEVNKILSERINKSMELANQMRSDKIEPEDFRTKMETLRTESNEKVKGILLPEQYVEYQRIESEAMGGPGGGMRMDRGPRQQGQQGQQETPQQPPTPPPR